MDILDNFKPIPHMTAEQTREYIKNNARESYTLLDCRGPDEYENEHIPGAILIPLHEIPGRMSELDRAKPHIVYCRSGSRSEAATSIMLGNDFKEVYNMEGGMLAWNGCKATGVPMGGMFCCPPGAGLEEVTALAWAMEEGARILYHTVAENLDDKECKELYFDLVESEDDHKKVLLGVYREITGKDDIEGLFGDKSEVVYMEGGIKLKEALEWAEGKESFEIMEYLMTLESNSYDLYSKIARHCEDESKARIFSKLADEELDHLIRLSEIACKKR